MVWFWRAFGATTVRPLLVSFLPHPRSERKGTRQGTRQMSKQTHKTSTALKHDLAEALRKLPRCRVYERALRKAQRMLKASAR